MGAGAAVAKAAKLVLKGASELRRLLTSSSAEYGANVSCEALYDRLIEEEAREHEANQMQDHDDHAQDKADQDASTGTYCSAWSGFGFFKANGEEIGEVVLHENGGGSTSYQGTQE